MRHTNLSAIEFWELFDSFGKFVPNRLSLDNCRFIAPWGSQTDITRRIWLAGQGIAGEAGEISELHKKWLLGKEMNREALLLEMGDLLWYFELMRQVWDFTWDDIIESNRRKLLARYPERAAE